MKREAGQSVRRKLAGVLTCVTLAACASGPTAPRAISIETDRAAYVPGGQVLVHFRNDSQEPLGYNGCVGVLEVRLHGDWVTVGPAAGEHPCLDRLFALQPLTLETVALDLALSLSPGTYRYRFDVYDKVGNLLALQERVSNTFSVASS